MSFSASRAASDGKIAIDPDLTVLEAATPIPDSSAPKVPIRARCISFIERLWIRTPLGRLLEERANRRRAQLASLEAKNAAFLAECANLSVPDSLQKFDSSVNGINDSQIQALLAQYGRNVLSSAKPRHWWSIFLACLPNPFNTLLTVLAIISIATGQTATFVILMIMVALSVGLRFWQEIKNNVAMNELMKLVHDNVSVVRNARDVEIPTADLVPGDIVRLSGGDVVPADIVLIHTSGIYVSQSTLTGETLPVLKQTTTTPVESYSILDALNICFTGTTVVSGAATGLVVATGDETYLGCLSKSITQKQDKNEFERGLWRVSYMLIAFMTIMVPIVLIISGLVSKDWGSAALFCIAVAVGLTPEMLPMVMNANMCHAAIKLARLKVIVKRLDSVQSLGGIDVLCSDKTGTLTKDDISLTAVVDALGRESEMTLRLAFLNAVFQEGLRNAIDSAIVARVDERSDKEQHLKTRQGYEKIAELPFDFERRLLSIVVRDPSGATMMITKGAAEEVLSKCTHVQIDGSDLPLTAERRQLEKLCTSFNENGMRIVAVAARNITVSEKKDISVNDESDLTFHGFLAFLDPPKEDAAEAINELQRYGVSVKILTGDNVAAAQAVASKIGLLGPSDRHKVISGPELVELDDTMLKEKAEECIVFAKLKPLQKQQIVRILERNGHSVGFLGDGINDAPALRSADVGISVDTGTSVAKQAANIILLQKSLTHVITGVVYGRITQGNSLKYIKMASSSNFGNIFSVTIAACWLPFVPMAPLQLLIQNLCYDVSQASIPWDHVDPELIEHPRKWKVWSIVRFMIWLGPTSSIFDICTFLLGWYFYGIRSADNVKEVQTFQTQWFTEGLLTQVLIVIMLRTQHIPIIQSRPSKVMGTALFCICVVGLSIPYLPGISSALDMQRPNPTFYAFLVPILICYMLLVQLIKVIYKRIYHEWL